MYPARTPIVALVCLLLASTNSYCAPQEKSTNGEGEHSLSHAIEPVAETGENWARLHSLLISRDGRLVYERYFNGRGPDQLDNVKSVSKSILSALVGIAIARGELNGLDDTLDAFFGAELQDPADRDKANISLENLLTMQSGLRSTSSENYGGWVLSDNWIASVLDPPLQATPGKEMSYSTGNTHLLSAILTRATGRSTLDFAREMLAGPMGFELAPWPRDPQGIYFGGNDMLLTPRQLLALGELYLNGGRRDERQIIPADWVAASLTPRTKSPHGAARFYGYGWWVTELMGHVVPHAWGHGGQFVMIVPDLEVVLVSTSSIGPGRAANDHANKVYGMLQQMIHTIDRLDADDRTLLAMQQ
jgi:CubicO group peptidase (beta-lactamase class C family)